MNRTEWEASNDPFPMLDWLRERGSGRKFRLLACAAASMVEETLSRYDPGIGDRIDQAERLSDNLRPLPHLSPRRRGSGLSPQALARRAADALSEEPGVLAARATLWWIARFLETLRRGDGGAAPLGGVYRRQAALFRDLFGHLYHADLLWVGRLERTGEAERLARAIYEERSFADLPVLADALEEAGCADEEVLGHCRGGGEHARGCWVVDALLGRG